MQRSWPRGQPNDWPSSRPLARCSKVARSPGEEGAGSGSSRSIQGMDQSKKTMRHFYCRDVLWETFEQMANDFDCSIDYLVNEAMRYYARSKNYQSPGGPQMTGGQPVGAGPGAMGGAGSSGASPYPT